MITGEIYRKWPILHATLNGAAALTFVLSLVALAAAKDAITVPLRALATNPNYFTNDTGKACVSNRISYLE